MKKYGIIVIALIFLMSCGDNTSQQAAPPDIACVEIIQDSVELKKDFVGQIYGEFDIPIRARVSGFLEGMHFDEGRRVSKGQLLYTIDPQPFEAEVARQMSTLAEARTALAKAESDLNRYKPLAEINAVAQSDLDAAQAQYDAALAYVDAANASVRLARINLGYCRMSAPISGVIGKTKAKIGEFVGQDPNPVILNTVSKIERVRVEFFLSESEFLSFSRERIEEIQKITEMEEAEKKKEKASLELILADGSIFAHKGVADFIDREVDPSTGAILIQASFPNPDRLLRPGLFGRVRAIMDRIGDAILVPQKCVSEIQGSYSVYKVGADNKLQFQAVEVGASLGDMWLINKGLVKGDIVVLEGLQQVKEGQVINPVIQQFESKSELINN
ncbi:MAG: efflux RND transporter periplasmic adaptor subunit [Bacteroidota bacterium]|nr:efflux RND transporter periplasmic adaptor subunit [Bacteroidota bacterium]